MRSKLRALCVEANLVNMAEAVACLGVLVAALCFAAGTLGFVRRPWALRLIRAACFGCWILGVIYLRAVYVGTALPLKNNLEVVRITPTVTYEELPADKRPAWQRLIAPIKPKVKERGTSVEAVTFTSYAQFVCRMNFLWPAFLIAALLGALDLLSWRRAAMAVYFRREDLPPQPGDRFLENLRTNGRAPRFRKGVYTSATLHLMVIVVIPWLLYSVGGCIPPYKVPKGSGEPVVNVARQIKIKNPKKKKPKKVLVNNNSAILFYHPDFDDSKVESQVEFESRETYVADPQRVMNPLGTPKTGNTGTGSKGKGGWPDGMDGHCVRLIRLEYNCQGWDDGMDSASRADLNFLDKFKELTGFKVADKVESYPIRYLRSCKKGYAPPFVFITGARSFTISGSDTKIFREYVLGGGMIFADCSSAEWGNAFRQYVQAQLLPGHAILDIADDDPLFQQPYYFPNGAPPLWHHAGTRVWGVKHNGRWLVYCHPGDLHDAWKTGHSGMDPQRAADAFRVGINVMYYAFTRYLEQTRNERK
ncbi:MAG: DUF4159 domain-containing protein [Kiritimatiellia bacterium]